jgi:hypothetical protein
MGSKDEEQNGKTSSSDESGDDPSTPHIDGDLGDLLQELRVLLQGVQVLTGFLIVLPFNDYFRGISDNAHRVYLVLFLCVLTSLILFSAPAAQHRLLTPLSNRVSFKRFATRIIIIGLVPFSASLVLATHFVVNEVAGNAAAMICAAIVFTTILGLWWLLPARLRATNAQRDLRGKRPDSR